MKKMGRPNQTPRFTKESEGHTTTTTALILEAKQERVEQQPSPTVAEENMVALSH